MKKPSEQLRRIIATCGMSRYAIAQESGVSEAALSKLMSGKHVNTETLDRLADVLGLRIISDIVPTKAMKASKGKASKRTKGK